MDDTDRELVRGAIESALTTLTGDKIAVGLEDMGWLDLLQEDPATAVGELFEAQGRLTATTAMLDRVLTRELNIDLVRRVAVVHPVPNRAATLPERRPNQDGSIAFEGFVFGGTDRADELRVPIELETGRHWGSVAVAEVAQTPVLGMDPSLDVVLVRGVVDGGSALPGYAAASMTMAARRALGHELVGLGQAMLDTACEYVGGRIQFGQPIAAFQVVRHALADVHVAVTGARALLDAAWTTDDPLVAAAAKASAGSAALLAAKHCLQVTGAIGYSWEYGLHRQIRRVEVLNVLYGSAAALKVELGQALLDNPDMPWIDLDQADHQASGRSGAESTRGTDQS